MQFLMAVDGKRITSWCFADGTDRPRWLRSPNPCQLFPFSSFSSSSSSSAFSFSSFSAFSSFFSSSSCCFIDLPALIQSDGTAADLSNGSSVPVVQLLQLLPLAMLCLYKSSSELIQSNATMLHLLQCYICFSAILLQFATTLCCHRTLCSSRKPNYRDWMEAMISHDLMKT